MDNHLQPEDKDLTHYSFGKATFSRNNLWDFIANHLRDYRPYKLLTSDVKQEKQQTFGLSCAEHFSELLVFATMQDSDTAPSLSGN